MKKMKIKAFSLVEMMMLMLVASIIMAAAAPIITKKVERPETPYKNTGMPSGLIVAYTGIINASNPLPTGWLLCDGASYNKADYPDLYAALGGDSSPYGVSGGTFNVPDLRGRITVGQDTFNGIDGPVSRVMDTNKNNVGTVIGATGGSATNQVVTANLPAHTHPGVTTSYYDSENRDIDPSSYWWAGGIYPHTTSSFVNITTTPNEASLLPVSHTHSGNTLTTADGVTATQSGAHSHGALYFWASEHDNGDSGDWIRTSHDDMYPIRKQISTAGIVSSSGSSHQHSFTTPISQQEFGYPAYSEHRHSISTDGDHAHAFSFKTMNDGVSGYSTTEGVAPSYNKMPPYSTQIYLIKI